MSNDDTKEDGSYEGRIMSEWNEPEWEHEMWKLIEANTTNVALLIACLKYITRRRKRDNFVGDHKEVRRADELLKQFKPLKEIALKTGEKKSKFMTNKRADDLYRQRNKLEELLRDDNSST